MGARGFTLVEALVAMVVLAVGLLAMAGMSITSVQANAYTQQLDAATAVARERMELLQSYSRPERADGFSVFDFDYLVNTGTNFASIEDPPGSGSPLVIHGLLSGSSGGTDVTSTGGKIFEVMYDDGSNGDQTAGDGVYTDADTVQTSATAAGYTVTRVWTVAQLNDDFAAVTVQASWTGRFGQTRTVNLASVVNRRQ
jgi:prepilin-type N-terminal cleavage/methylation domain-containing protein